MVASRAYFLQPVPPGSKDPRGYRLNKCNIAK